MEPTIPFSQPPAFSSLNELSQLAHNQAEKSGFYDIVETESAYVSRALLNMQTEVCELWEAFRRNQAGNLCDKAEAMVAHGLPALTCEEEELADLVIRALDYAAEREINLSRAVAAKHAYNGTRAYRHGGKIA